MSVFIHSNEEFSNLYKFVNEELILPHYATKNIINYLHKCEVESYQERYGAIENPKLKIKDNKAITINKYDALKMLNSILYQSSEMSNEKHWDKLLDLFRKIKALIKSVLNVEEDYKSNEIYRNSMCWG